jgi:L-ascorbate metabolism protein UlaG (beta-lactamase superfamily)
MVDSFGMDESRHNSGILNQHVYLKPEVKIEPLSCGWYAWSHLISPHQHAMNIAYRHIPLLQSFVQNPSVHVAASKDRSLFGGPFVDLPLEELANVKTLLERTRSECGKLIALARDLKQLDEKLQNTARGYSLSEFYGLLPESLGGLVEFFYDVNNHPKIRFYEELVYDEYFSAAVQEIALSLSGEADRRFFMSTPRISSATCMNLKIPFGDSRLDLLASMRLTAIPFPRIAQAFDIAGEQLSVFRNFFTHAPPQRKDLKYHGDGVRIRYFGHACVLIQTSQVAILIDPMFALDRDKDDGRFTINDLPDHLNYVVLTHNHQDHCSLEMLIQIRHRIGRLIVPSSNSGSITDPSMKLMLNRLGFPNVDVLEAFSDIQFADGRITSLPFPGEHVDLDIYSRHGIHIEVKGRKFVFLVDSDGCDPTLFRRIGRKLGTQLDALFIGMECHGAPMTWLYGPLLTKPVSRRDDESRRLSGLDSARAWKVLGEFDASNVYVYAMGQEPWLRYIMGLEYSPESIQLREVAEFLKLCSEHGISAEQLYMSKDMEF